MQLSEQVFWLSDPTHNMADLSEHCMAQDKETTLPLHFNSIGKVDGACFMFKTDVEMLLWSPAFSAWLLSELCSLVRILTNEQRLN